MTLIAALVASVALVQGAAAAETAPSCEVPESLLSANIDLTRVASSIKEHHRLDISVVGSASSALTGPDGARFAYPAQLEKALRERLPGNEIRVTAHIQSRQPTADMAASLAGIVKEDQPVLVIWQAGTVDAMRGVEPDDFRNSLDQGLDAIAAGNADVILMNMQYSPRTETMLNVSTYADVMRWVAEQRDILLFDRLAIMHYWSDEGIFDRKQHHSHHNASRPKEPAVAVPKSATVTGP